MKSIVVGGKDQKAAIKNGLKELNVNHDQVEIEYIQREEKGFLGIGKKEAKIRLTVKQSNETIQKPVSAWIENGQVYAHHIEDKHPMIEIPDDIQVIKNNEIVDTTQTTLTADDVVEINIQQEDPVATKWRIVLDNYKLEAMLEIDPGYQIVKTLQDSPPNMQLKLSYQEETMTNNDLTLEQVIEALKEKAITFGLDQNALQEALVAKEPGQFLVAKGIAPIAGKNGWIEKKVDTEVADRLDENQDGQINYRDSHVIPTVEKGDIIGTIHPPIPGKNGTTVTGETIEVEPVSPIEVTEGTGTVIVGDKVVANANGRPLIEQVGLAIKAMVVPQFVQEGDVTFSTGNIHFHGDVDINGSIEEGMFIEAGGDIRVAQSVYEAELTASKSITIEGAVHASKVSAGKNNMSIYELGLKLEKIITMMDDLYAMVKQITQQANELDRGKLKPILLKLVEKKHRLLPNHIKELSSAIATKKNDIHDSTWFTSVDELSRLFISLNDQSMTIEQLENLMQTLKNLRASSQLEGKVESVLSVSNALNSTLSCSGDISITGKSCINSKIVAGGMYRSDGVVRGGEIFASKGVELAEAGAISETTTIIAAPKNQMIVINKVHPGTVIQIGESQHLFTEEKSHINAHITSEGYLLFH
ncbi:flagellar assembly protein A [Paraliobacillus ryukyuensis]|uniref:flagellar assembly protein A n=1 Tax=Paraliobacillus ryukyuensis TaxID=200904 RepID=UPI0009A64253|nr:FapA family protein [Paraliobacillus ryukyuensis]